MTHLEPPTKVPSGHIVVLPFPPLTNPPSGVMRGVPPTNPPLGVIVHCPPAGIKEPSGHIWQPLLPDTNCPFGHIDCANDVAAVSARTTIKMSFLICMNSSRLFSVCVKLKRKYMVLPVAYKSMKYNRPCLIGENRQMPK
jgi:hypothetical protein